MSALSHNFASLRIGQGYDIHRLAANHPFILGGIPIESPLGTIAHSDGDVILHALIDAILGATANGDIGEHFPPSNPAFKDADSSQLLHEALNIAGAIQIINVDCTVFLESPKLSPYKQRIREHLAQLLNIPITNVAFKAKTAEKLGAIGHREAVAASITVLLSLD